MITNNTKGIPIKRAFALIVEWVKSLGGLQPTEEQLFNLMLASCKEHEIPESNVKVYSISDLLQLKANLFDAIKNKDAAYLTMRRGMCVDRMVDIQEFCESNEYMAQKAHIRPVVLAGLIELFSRDYIEVGLGGATSWGKCLKEAVIVTDNGPVLLSSLVGKRNLKTLSMDKNGNLTYKPAIAKKSGRKRCLRLKFSGGLVIEASHDHPFKVRDDYKKAEDLVIGDMIACCAFIPEGMATNQVDEPTAMLLGYLVGDGGCTSSHVSFTNESKDVWYEIERLSIKLAPIGEGGLGKIQKSKSKAIERNILGVNDIVRTFAIACKANEKRIPQILFTEPLPVVAKFINRLFTCDGSVSATKEGKIEITLASEGLIDDLLYLLLRFGIVGRKFSRIIKLSGKEFNAYRLTITGAENIDKFFKSIGYIFTKEANSLKLHEAAIRKITSGVTHSNYPIPVTVEDLRGLQGRGRFNRPKGHCYTKGAFKKIAEAYPDFTYNWTANSDIRWEKLVSVEAIGVHDVYDLEVADNHNFVANGLIVHNTWFSILAMAYMIYQLSCYHNPQIEWGMAPGTSIVFIQQSQRAELAKKVIFTQFTEMLKRSPYFMKTFPFDPQIKSELRFPKQVALYPVGGADTAALGMNVWAAILDELNFMARVKDSSLTRFGADEEYDQADALYRALIRRIKGRFMDKGVIPGRLLLISSTNYKGDFMWRKMEEAKTDKTILYLSYSQWEALPADRFSGDKFLIELGSEERRSRIIQTREESRDPDSILEVPVEYKADFERDIAAALKDYAGVSTGTMNPYILDRERMVKAARDHQQMNDGQSLFTCDSAVLQSMVDGGDSIRDFSRLVNLDYIEKYILDSTQPFAVHIDVGISQDRAGLSVGRIYGYKLIPASKWYDPSSKQFVEIRDIRMPIYMIDGALQIMPPPSDEVDLELLRDLVLYLRGLLYIKWATMDSFQSAMLIQAFRKAKIRSGVLSIDTDIAPYAETKLAIKDERIYYPGSEVVLREFRDLERDAEKNKVDHKDGSSKDVTDSIAGVVFMLYRKEADLSHSGGSRSLTDRHRIENPDKAANKVRVVHVKGRL